MSILTNLNYRFNAIPNKIPANCFIDIDKMDLKFIWRDKRPIIANTILNKNKIRDCYYLISILTIKLQ